MDIKAATQTFLDIKKILDQAGVKFWIVDGTALGAVRDSSFILYDTDIDLRISAKDTSIYICEKFKKKGFQCSKIILYHDLISAYAIKKRGIRADIAATYYYPPEDLSVVLAKKPRACITVTPAKFYREDYFIEFLGTKVRLPNPPDEYLNLHYGKNWRIPIKDKVRPVTCIPISIAKYVKYFHEHPEINQKKDGNNA